MKQLNRISKSLGAARLDWWEAKFFAPRVKRAWRTRAKKVAHRADRRLARVLTAEGV